MYLVSENMSGVQHPIHVQKLIIPGRTPILFCESKKCQDSFNAHGIAGIEHFECDHLLSTPFFNCMEPIELDTCVLYDLVESLGISDERKVACIQRKKTS